MINLSSVVAVAVVAVVAVVVVLPPRCTNTLLYALLESAYALA
jgi:hypothetical protein